MEQQQMSAYGSIASSIIGAWSTNQDIKSNENIAMANIARKSKAVSDSLEKSQDSYITRMNFSYEQSEAINRQLGDALSQRGLEAMKAKSRLITSGAGTGISGASIDEISNQAGFNRIFDEQVLISRARQSKTDLATQRVTDWMNYEIESKNIAQGMAMNIQAPQSSFTSIASGLSAGLNTYMSMSSFSNNQNTSTFQSMATTGSEMNNSSIGWNGTIVDE